jgi:hypothetical protein
MTRHEKVFFDKTFRGGNREVFTAGVDPEKWEIEVRRLLYRRGRLDEEQRYRLSEFLGRDDQGLPIESLKRMLADWHSKLGLEPANDFVNADRT